jgi:hypothetical protein
MSASTTLTGDQHIVHSRVREWHRNSLVVKGNTLDTGTFFLRLKHKKNVSDPRFVIKTFRYKEHSPYYIIKGSPKTNITVSYGQYSLNFDVPTFTGEQPVSISAEVLASSTPEGLQEVINCRLPAGVIYRGEILKAQAKGYQIQLPNDKIGSNLGLRLDVQTKDEQTLTLVYDTITSKFVERAEIQAITF